MKIDIEVHPHWHSEVEILYFISGHARQQVNEQYFIAGPGDVVVINRDQLHSTYSYAGSSCEVLVIMFDAPGFIEYFTDGGIKAEPYIYGNSIVFGNPLKSTSAFSGPLIKCLKEIHKELSLKKRAYRYMVKSYMYRMTAILDRLGSYEVYRTNENDMKKIRSILKSTFDLIDSSYFEDVGLEKAASNSNLSVSHFCRLFKRATGMTFSEYLAFYRVNCAEKMLGSEKSITEIALECGFGSISSFIRNFKKFKQCTPSSYKEIKYSGTNGQYISE